jgi:hypothetical protein
MFRRASHKSLLVARLAKLSVNILGLIWAPKDGDVIAKPLVMVSFGFYATVDRHDQVETGDEPVFVGFDETNAYLPEALWLSS